MKERVMFRHKTQKIKKRAYMRNEKFTAVTSYK